MIEEAESILKSMGCRQLRVRLHHDDIARIEVDKEDLAFFSLLTYLKQYSPGTKVTHYGNLS
jgi:PP-loop superfamily ATP-utilizing enzyme